MEQDTCHEESRFVRRDGAQVAALRGNYSHAVRISIGAVLDIVLKATIALTYGSIGHYKLYTIEMIPASSLSNYRNTLLNSSSNLKTAQEDHDASQIHSPAPSRFPSR